MRKSMKRILAMALALVLGINTLIATGVFASEDEIPGGQSGEQTDTAGADTPLAFSLFSTPMGRDMPEENNIALTLEGGKPNVPAGGEIDLAVGLDFANAADEYFHYKEPWVEITLPAPLEAIHVGGIGHSWVKAWDFDKPTGVLKIEFVDFDNALTKGSSSEKIPFTVKFPAMTTLDGAGGELVAEFFQEIDGTPENLSKPRQGEGSKIRVPKAKETISATAKWEWSLDKWLASKEGSPYGTNVQYRLHGTTVNDLQPERSVNFVTVFKNEENKKGDKNAQNVAGTYRLGFSQSFTLPAGVKLTNGKVDITVTVYDHDGNTVVTTDPVTVAKGADETYTISGTWERDLENGPNDLATRFLLVQLDNLKFDHSVIISTPDVWTQTGTDYHATFPSTVRATAYKYGDDVGTTGTKEVKATFYTGTVPPPNSDADGVSELGIKKEITNRDKVTYPSTDWDTKKFKTFKIHGFDNIDRTADGKNYIAYSELKNFTVRDDFDYNDMKPISVTVGKYDRYSGPLNVVAIMKNNSEQQIFSGTPDNQAEIKLADQGIDPADVKAIEYRFGTVQSGFKITTAPQIKFETLIPPSATQKTISNKATVNADYLGAAVGPKDATASYNLDYKGGVKVGINKIASRAISQKGETLTYWLVVKNEGHTDIYDLEVTDQLPAKHLENFGTPEYYVGPIEPNAELIPTLAGYEANFGTAASGGSVTRDPSTDPFLNDPPTVKFTFSNFNLEPGKMLVIKISVDVKSNTPDGTILENKFKVDYDYQNPGAGTPSEGETGWSNGVKTSVLDGNSQLAVLKVADKLPRGSDFNHDGSSVFAGPGAGGIPDSQLPANDNSRYGQVPEYDQGNKVTYTVFVKNTGNRDLEKYYIKDLIETYHNEKGSNNDLTAAQKNLRNIFAFDDTNKAPRIESLVVTHSDGTTLFDLHDGGTINYGAGRLYADTAETVRVGAKMDGDRGGLYISVIAGNGIPVLAQNDELKIEYSLSLLPDIEQKGVTLPIKLRNRVRVYNPISYQDSTFNEIIGDLNGHTRYGYGLEKVGGSHNGAIYNDAYIAIQPRNTPKIGISKETVYIGGVDGYKDLRVRDKNSDIGANNDSGWLRRGTDTNSDKRGAYFTYKITIENQTGKEIPANTLKIYDVLPLGQKPADIDNKLTPGDGDVVIYTKQADGTYKPYKGSAIDVGQTPDVSVGNDKRHLYRFNNPEAIPDGESLDIYVRAIVKDNDALIGALTANHDYATKDQFPFQNDVALVNTQGWKPIDGKGTPKDTFYGALAGKESTFITAKCDITYYKDRIAPGITKSVNNSRITPNQHLSFTIDVTNPSADKSMDNYKVVDYLDAAFNFDQSNANFTYTKNGTAVSPSSVTVNPPVNGYHEIVWTFTNVPLWKTDKLTITYDVQGLSKDTGHFRNHAVLVPDEDFLNWNSGHFLDEDILNDINNSNNDIANSDYDGLRENLKQWIGTGAGKKDGGLWVECAVTVTSVSGLETTKGIRRQGDTDFVENHGNKEKAIVEQVPGGFVDYRLTVRNTGSKVFERIKILDILPHIGDTGIHVQSDRRGSAFALTFGAASAATVYDHNGDTIPGATISYGEGYETTDIPMDVNDSSSANPWNSRLPLNNATADGNAVFLNLNGFTLKGGQSLTVDFSAKLPELPIVTDPDDAMKKSDVAWNTFAVELKPGNGSKGRTEPLRVGVRYGVAGLTIEKQVPADYQGDRSGFQFRITDMTNAQAPVEATTGQDGKVFFGNLVRGRQYKLEEIGQKDLEIKKWTLIGGNTETTEAYTFTVPESGDMLLTAVNGYPSSHRGSLEVRKQIDNASNPDLDGYTFTLTPVNGGAAISITTDQYGVALFENLELGDYTLTEASNPGRYTFRKWVVDGVEHTNATLPVTISGAKQNVTVEAHNELILGSATVNKAIPDEPGADLSGFTFTLTDTKTGAIQGTAVTDASGVAHFGNLIIGRTYALFETGTKGYTLTGWIVDGVAVDNSPAVFTLTETRKDIEVTANNKLPDPNKGVITVQKRVQGDENTDLSGFVFTLTGPQGFTADARMTDSNGVATFYDLDIGNTYYLEETGTNGLFFTGWIRGTDLLGDKVLPIHLDTQGQHVELTAINRTEESPPRGINLRKVDAGTGRGLAGAVFTLQRPDGSTETLNFGSNTSMTISLPQQGYAGTYILRETAAPSGYLLNIAPITFQIAQNYTITCTGYNHVVVASDGIGLIVGNVGYTPPSGGGDDPGPSAPPDTNPPRPTPPGGGGPGGSGGGSNPNDDPDYTPIGDEPTPLANLSGLTTIFDDDVPLGGLPWAGGRAVSIILLSAGCLLFGAGMLGSKWREKDDED